MCDETSARFAVDTNGTSVVVRSIMVLRSNICISSICAMCVNYELWPIKYCVKPQLCIKDDFFKIIFICLS